MKKVLITGATGGIGTYISEVLAEHKYGLILVSRNSSELLNLSSRLKERFHSDIDTIQCDVSNYEDLKKQFEGIKDVDIIINCAGILGPVGAFEENDIQEWEKAIQINLLGTVYVCHILMDRLKKSTHGKIINLSGGGAAFPRKYHTAYATSKAAIVRFSENLAIEYPSIDVNAIAPGAHKTKIWDTETFDKEPEKWADPKRLQELILYLCSGKSNGITGKFIHIYDDWDKENFQKIKPDELVLRRVDEQLLRKLR